MDTRPTLVVISGAAGTGKTTLAHELARSIPCPAICRDEIKEGMAFTVSNFTPAPGDDLTQRTFPLFFQILRLLLEAGVTVVAEATFVHRTWQPELERLSDVAQLRVLRCHTDSATALRRIMDRKSQRAAHADEALLERIAMNDRWIEEFEHLAIDAPTIDVDTTAGYKPSLIALTEFATLRQ